MKRKISFLYIMLFLSVTVWAQQGQPTVKLTPYGFVRTYVNYDSRRTYTVLGGEYNMLPYDNLWNADSTADLNAEPRMQIQALTSRVGLKVDGPRMGRVETGAVLEGDFGGFGTNNSVLRLRLAYMQFSMRSAGKDSLHQSTRYMLRIGQDWHPLSGGIMPEVLGMAAGAPFRPHSRTPQVSAEIWHGKVGLTAAVLGQLQFMNDGPLSPTDSSSSPSLSYATTALWPEAFLGVGYRAGGFYAQIGLDAQIIRPRTKALVNGVVRPVKEKLETVSPTLYVQYTERMWSVKMRTLLASSTSHLNQLVGYGVSRVGEDGSWGYSPLRAAIGYADVCVGKKWQGNLFIGYMKNLGAAEELHDFGSGRYLIYMKGGEEFTRLNSLWRIAPSVCYNRGCISVGVEYELTGATYGDISSRGSIELNESLHAVSNHRVCMMMKYNF